MTDCLLQGMKEVMEAFKLSRDQFYMFLNLGMPMRKINGRWYGHRENIKDFFRKSTIGPPVEVDEDAIEGIAEN